MGNSFRLERRYYLPAGQEKSISSYLDTFPGLLKVVFPSPITQTVYFTQGRTTKYTVPTGKIIRVRKYSDDKFILRLGNELVYLEIKTLNKWWNSKERIALSGQQVFDFLSMKDITQVIGNIFDILPMFPAVGTSTHRSHWVHQSGLRITLDDDIAFFTFTEECNEGYFSEMCNEGKIEFKFPKSDSNKLEVLLKNILIGLTDCVERDADYLERRLRQCFFQNLKR
jgi:hypothetical protein